MDELKKDLNEVNVRIDELEIQIANAKKIAEGNIEPLNIELKQVKQDKSHFATKNDFNSLQDCRRKEENLKFKINAQWNEYSTLKNKLTVLKKEKTNLENAIKLKKDRMKRHEELTNQMDSVLKNYQKTQNLKQSAIDSNINPDSVEQWFEWGRQDFNETYSYFYARILEIDDYFKNLEAQKLKKQMDSVAEAYMKTGSLKRACEIADVSYDTAQYWLDWGSRGFGEENTYFYRKMKSIKK